MSSDQLPALQYKQNDPLSLGPQHAAMIDPTPPALEILTYPQYVCCGASQHLSERGCRVTLTFILNYD